ncbi:DUF4261 domain-containing protein, partial [Achromobacter xylosoxidans]|nr:DUF4261 domain-containing protein [Achromobacter xylosoxidans]
MSIFSRFFGRAESSADTVALTANPDMKDGPSLQVVFAAPLAPQADALAAALRAYHPEMREARAEIEPDMPELLALVGWGKHVVRLVGFNAPFPQDALEACVAPAHYPAEVKEQVRGHVSHVLLYYAGFETDPLEQYVALAAVAGALAGLQAVAVLNEDAHTSLPAGLFSRESMGDESLELLRSLPLNMLYCGFVKYEVEGVQGVWMRTYGAGRFGLPDFAVLAEGHHQGEQYSNMFNNIMAYLLDSGAELAAGHTMQIGEDRYMKLR